MAADKPRDTLLRGTLDMLILRTVERQPLHGYAIAQQIERLSQDVLAVEQGSLYPALERLQARGLVTGKAGTTSTGRQARYYTITRAGRKQLGEQISSFDRVLEAIRLVMQPVGDPD